MPSVLQEVILQAKLSFPLAVNLFLGVLQVLVIYAAVGQLGSESLAAASVATSTYMVLGPQCKADAIAV